MYNTHIFKKKEFKKQSDKITIILWEKNTLILHSLILFMKYRNVQYLILTKVFL